LNAIAVLPSVAPTLEDAQQRLKSGFADTFSVAKDLGDRDSSLIKALAAMLKALGSGGFPPFNDAA
jgi:hypothetical protein